MTWVAVGVGGATLVTGLMANDASRKAAGAQTGASAEAIKEQQKQAALTRADNAPFLSSGTSANRRLSNLLGLPGGEDAGAMEWAKNVYLPQIREHMAKEGGPDGGPGYLSPEWMPSDEQLRGWAKYAPDSVKQQDQEGQGSLTRKFSTADLEADPVYNAGLKFGLDRGTEGINARATASGMYDSGATLKALTQFGTDYGSTKAGESYNRFINDQNNTFNKIAGVSGAGQVATNQVASSGTNMVNNVGASLEGAGNARAAGIVGGANAWGNTATGLSGAANNYQSNKRLDALLASRYSGSSAPAYYNSGAE